MKGDCALINRRDVIRVKMPFPDIASNLAVKSHMYICRQVNQNTFYFVKCQTLKPYMLINSPIGHYWDEKPDIARNPFKNPTRIDCDKEFVTRNVSYSDNLKTTTRPDVCEDVITHIDNELICDGYSSHSIKEDDLLHLNSLVSRVV